MTYLTESKKLLVIVIVILDSINHKTWAYTLIKGQTCECFQVADTNNNCKFLVQLETKNLRTRPTPR